MFVIDLIFERPSYDEAENEYLINAFAGIKNGVVSCKLTDYDSQTDNFRKVRRSFFDGIDADITWAFSNVISGEGYGCIRRYSQNEHLNGKDIYSLPYMAVCKYTGEQPHVQIPKQRNIEYSNTDFIIVPHDKVIENKRLIKNKIVILGTINEEADSHITPLGKMAGMKIQAYAMLSSMSHHKIYVVDDWVSIVIAILLCYISAWVGFLIIKNHKFYYAYWLKLYYFYPLAELI